MKKIVILSLFTIISILSCNNNYLNPDAYTKEEIDRKYPYWNIGMSEFKIAENLTNYTTITVEEKRFILRCIALMRTALNTTEFVTEVKKKTLASSVNASYGNVSIKVGQIYDNDKLIEVVRSVQYTNFIYEKMNTGGAAFGSVGQSRYVRYVGGQDPSQIPTANWVGFENANWVQWSGNSLYGYASFSGLMFHEHMHNIGFTHVAQTSSNNVPYGLQGVVQSLIERILYGNLKDKYAKALDELTAYYYTEYKHLLLEDSVFDPSKK